MIIIYFCAKLRKGEDMVKIIIIIFVIVFSLVRAANKVKASEREKSKLLNYGDDRAMSSQEQSDEFDEDFRFLYENQSEDNIAEEPLNIKQEAQPMPAATSIDKSATAIESVDDIEDLEDNDDIERWRRSIIDAEILKTKF